MLLPLPSSLRTFVNVSNRLPADWMASSSTAIFSDNFPDRFSRCLAVTFATPAVLLMTALVWFPTLTDS